MFSLYLGDISRIFEGGFMRVFNEASKILSGTDEITGLSGAIYPDSCHLLFKSNLEDKIRKTRRQIENLEVPLNRKTHGGKRYRARKISRLGQVIVLSERLKILKKAQKIQMRCLENNLQLVRNAEGDINKIRMIFKGDKKTFCEVFQQAVRENDVISQIQLSHARFSMRRCLDDKKDFTKLSLEDLEAYSFYYPRELMLFNSAYSEVMGDKNDIATISQQTFRLAAKKGCLPAFLEIMDDEWGPRVNSFGFAAQLRPFVGRGDMMLDKLFGLALIHGCHPNSGLYLEGIYWLNRSTQILPQYPTNGETFKVFQSEYFNTRNCWDLSHEHFHVNGFEFVGNNAVLVPYKESWDEFVKEVLEKVKIASIETYEIKHDPQQIKSLCDEHEVTVRESKESICPPEENFHITSLEVQVGKLFRSAICVREDTFEIYSTFQIPEIQIIITFLEEVMKRTGSAYSAQAWLEQIKLNPSFEHPLKFATSKNARSVLCSRLNYS